MKAFLTRLYSVRLFRYLLIGGISYSIELAVLLLLANTMHLSPSLSVAYSFWVGLTASFLLQKYVAFSNTMHDKRSLGRQTILYGGLVLFNYLFTILFVDLFHPLVGLVAARTAALLLTVSWNYVLYKRIFRNA